MCISDYANLTAHTLNWRGRGEDIALISANRLTHTSPNTNTNANTTTHRSGGGAAQTAHHGDRAADDNETPVVHFRNYVPRSHEGEGGAGARGGGADGGVLDTQVARVPAAAPPPPTAMPSVPPPAAAAAANDVALPSDIPTKPNADLRREVAKQLAKLERRTQRALVEISVEEERRRGAEAASLGR